MLRSCVSPTGWGTLTVPQPPASLRLACPRERYVLHTKPTTGRLSLSPGDLLLFPLKPSHFKSEFRLQAPGSSSSSEADARRPAPFR